MNSYPSSIFHLIDDYVKTFGQVPPTWGVKERPYSSEWIQARWEEIMAGRQIHLLQPEDTVQLSPIQR
jgi:hypothetical protein